MKKHLSISILLLTLLLSISGCAEDTDSSTNDISSSGIELTQKDFLTTGFRDFIPTLLNQKGEAIVLRGTNAGGYMVQENWIANTDGKCQISTITTLDERFGVQQRKELINQYEENFWTEDDFIKCKELGFNVIRLPFSYMNLYDMDFSIIIRATSVNYSMDNLAADFLAEDITLREDAFDRMDWFVETAGKYGMYVILDLHGAFGSQNGRDHSGDNYWNDDSYNNDRLWWSGALGEAYRNATIKLWEDVARHYNGNPIIAAYDTLNEPAGNTTGVVTRKTQWDYFDRLYNAIRAIDTDHIIMFESCWDVEHLPRPDTYGWDNIMYQYHQYTWTETNNVDKQFGEMKKKIDKIVACDYGVPTLMGEFAMFSNPESWRKTFAALNAAGISWTTWTYKIKYSTSWHKSWGLYIMLAVQDVKIKTDSYETIMKKWGALQEISPTMTYPLVKEYTGGKAIWEPLA